MDIDEDHYYYYTNKAGLDEVRTNKVIASTTRQGDLMLGSGVYLTDLSPRSAQDVILTNCYGFMHSHVKDMVCSPYSISPK